MYSYSTINTPNRLSSRVDKSFNYMSKLPKILKHQIQIGQRIQPIVKEITNIDVQVTRYHNGILDIATNCQTNLNHLLYLKQLILDEVRMLDSMHNLKDITVFVSQQDNVTQPSQTQKRPDIHVAQSTIDGMRSIAKECIPNEELQKRLIQLSESLENKNRL